MYYYLYENIINRLLFVFTRKKTSDSLRASIICFTKGEISVRDKVNGSLAYKEVNGLGSLLVGRLLGLLKCAIF